MGISSELLKRLAEAITRHSAARSCDSSIAGSGKTTRFMNKHKDSTDRILSSPTIDLATTTAAMGNNWRAITGAQNEVNISDQIKEILNLLHVNKRGAQHTQSISVTHQALDRALSKFIQERYLGDRGWELTIDEVPLSAFRGIKVAVEPVMHDKFFSLVELNHYEKNPALMQVLVMDDSALDDITDKKAEGILSESRSMVTLAKNLQNEQYSTFISVPNYEDIRIARQKKKTFWLHTRSARRVDLYDMCESVHFMAAFFKQTAYSYALRLQGEDVDNWPDDNTGDMVHTGGERLTIRYFTPEGYNWTRHTADHSVLGQKNRHRLLHAIVKHIKASGKPWLIYSNVGKNQTTNASGLKNEDITDRERLLELTGGILHKDDQHVSDPDVTRLITSIEGVNSVQSYHNIAFLYHENLNDGRNVLDHAGIPSVMVDTATMVEKAYRLNHRGNIRSRNPSSEPLELIVPDKRTADGVAARFPGCTVEYLDIDIVPANTRIPPHLHQKKGPKTPYTKKDTAAFSSYCSRRRAKGIELLSKEDWYTTIRLPKLKKQPDYQAQG